MKRKLLTWTVLLGIVALNLPPLVFAAGGSVVINEVNWAGSSASSSAEWIELYNNSASTVDLTGWKIFDDGVAAVDLSGKQISPSGYFLIEDAETAVPTVIADLVAGLSLANTGDKLELKDGLGVMVDVVNGSGGSWYAGAVSGYLTMEKIAAGAGDSAGNFASSTGTPRAINSVSVIPENSPLVKLSADQNFVKTGDQIVFSVLAENLEEVFSYGLNITYDATVLKFVSVDKGDFLSEAGAVNTAFQSGLINGIEGNLSVAEARLEGQSSVSGDGEFFNITFEVIGSAGSKSAVAIAGSSFVSALDTDLEVIFSGDNLEVSDGKVSAVTDLNAVEGPERYQIKLIWSAVNAEKYLIQRKNSQGDFVQIGETTDLFFVDEDGLSDGGKIIPNLQYEYAVIAVSGGNSSQSAPVQGLDNRGLKGDNDRSDLVDGRDLQNIAKHFGETVDMETFEPLVDTTYDGRVDGSDLIDLGVNFAKTY